MDLIKQFAIECAGQKEWDFPKDPKSYTFTPDELAEFAELIVRECAQVCRDQPNIYALKADRDNCAIAIEEHFGVE
jgi:hypothetical protein